MARADSAIVHLPGDVLTMEVAGLGRVDTPIRAAQAKKLIGAARPVQYGHGEDTLTDTTVRDSWEITPDQVRLGGPTWQSHLDAALADLSETLGLPAGSRLTAQLHSLLIYGKGQFFLPHQDSEKHDDMVASLVVTLPSTYTGGELVVDDAGHEQVYRGSRTDLVLVAYYADRRHEVRPVRSGHRVTLTFNLLLDRHAATLALGPTEQLAASLTEHFTSPATTTYGRELGVPTRLAFLLDHEYTQAGLRGGRLKGADAKRVKLLRAAAEQAGCESVLAQAEIQETWQVRPGGGSWGDDWDNDWDDEPQDEDPEQHDLDGDYELDYLVVDEMTLSWWTTPDGPGAEKIQLRLDGEEVCMVTPTKSLTPYESEYEGYMGNYGHTVERWYRRAALVMWPRASTFAVRAEAGSGWALEELQRQIDAGKLDGARADALALRPFWTGVDSALRLPALRVAVGLADPAAARVVAAPFRLESLTAEHAPILAEIARAYGDPWLRTLLGDWDISIRIGVPGRCAWAAESLPPLCKKLRDLDAHAIATGLVDRVWGRLRSQIDAGLAQVDPERRRMGLARLAELLAQTLAAASDEQGVAIAVSLRADGDDVLALLIPMLRAHRPPPHPAVVAIASDCRHRLALLTEAPARAKDDWSIAWSACSCDLCVRLSGFLGAAHQTTLEWPLAKAGRQHIHQQLDEAGLPVRHTTRRQGSPYTLVLTKTRDLFRREQTAREQSRTGLAWLASAFG
ncbi:2OG-Fe(II) oxygenase [Tomitella biformata]|uniref:2OG-Fe(II) oxygenase n=1 Tax=Tomitella biformata TaxID=630403 RepID=UPI0019032061|nr:2OG-Fe(II) oxygenase [Tomitella biformata]